MAGNVQTQIQTQEQVGIQVLTPQQLLEVRILELTSPELEERIRGELQDNPAFDQEEASDQEDFQNQDNNQEDPSQTDSYSSSDYDYGSDDYQDNESQGNPSNNWIESTVTGGESFLDLIKDQLKELELDSQDMIIAEYIAASLENSGYLQKNASEIAYELEVYHYIDVTLDHIEKIISVIKSLDPAGIGAKDLQECLLLQIERKLETSPNNKILLLGEKVVTGMFQDFIGKHWDKITDQLSVSQEESRAVLNMLTHLNPLPGSSMGTNGTNNISITPDFIVDVQGSSISFSLNNAHTPVLKISSEFEQMLEEQSQSKNTRDKDAALFLKQKIDAAKGFIQAVQQRQNTLTKVMRAITAIQRHYFLDADESHLKPMVLKDVAEFTGLDISTVSRACAGKYMQTDWGILPLKFFFTDGKKGDDGLEVSVRHIHNLIKEIIGNEDPACPLTDQQIVDILNAKGFQVARRTVVKYRTALGIPVARLRRKTV